MIQSSQGEQPELVIGAPADGRLTIRVLGRERPDAYDFDDGNWLPSAVSVRSGGFKAKVRASLRADEFERFYAELSPLYETLSGQARFESLEPWLRLQVTGDGRGHFSAACQLTDTAGTSMECALTFDRTEVWRMLRELEAILTAYPVRGKPPA
jgi:hypothetical protein